MSDHDACVKTVVVAPNKRLYEFWIESRKLAYAHYRYVHREDQLVAYYGKIIVLNGGPVDPHLRHLIFHPTRVPLLEHVRVLHGFSVPACVRPQDRTASRSFPGNGLHLA